MNSRDRITLALLTAVFCWGMVGCSNQNVKGAETPRTLDYVEGATVGGVFGAMVGGFSKGGSAGLSALGGAMIGAPIGAYYDTEGAIQILQREGITVARMGDVLEIVIPSDILFEANDTEIRLSAQPAMNRVVAFIKQYGNSNMSVIAHTDNVGTLFGQLELSRLQAQSVTTYLWTHGIHLQLMDFYGMGSEETAASNLTSTGSGYNRRVEITVWREGVPGPLNAILAKRSQDCWMADDPEACNNNQIITDQWADP